MVSGCRVSVPAQKRVFYVQLWSRPTALAATEPAEAVSDLRALCVWKTDAGRGDGTALSRSSKIPLKPRQICFQRRGEGATPRLCVALIDLRAKTFGSCDHRLKHITRPFLDSAASCCFTGSQWVNHKWTSHFVFSLLPSFIVLCLLSSLATIPFFF